MAVLDQILASFNLNGEGIGSRLDVSFLLLNSFGSLLLLALKFLLSDHHTSDMADVCGLNFVLIERLEVFLSRSILGLVDLGEFLIVFLDLGREFLSSISHLALLVTLSL